MQPVFRQIPVLLALALLGCAPAAAPGAQPGDVVMSSSSDRARIIEEGAKKEGKLVWYTTTTHNPAFKAAFEKQYPGITVEAFRIDSADLIRRSVEEYQAGVYNVDVVEGESSIMAPLKKAGVVQRFTSPELKAFPDEVKDKDGQYVIMNESYQSLGYNTKVLREEELPKNHQELLDPKWKGKMAIPGSSTGVRFVGSMTLLYGEDFVKKLAANDVKLVQVSGRALSDMVIAGEFPLSPTIFQSHVTVSSKEGAPFGFKALEPVVANTSAVSVAKRPNNPHAAMLFVDWILSLDGAKVHQERGFFSPRTDISNRDTVKKQYLEQAVGDYEKEFEKWQQLLKTFAVRQ